MFKITVHRPLMPFYFLANLTDPYNVLTCHQPLFQTDQFPVQLQILRDTEWSFSLSKYCANSPTIHRHCLCYYDGDSSLPAQQLMRRFRLGDLNNFSIVANFYLDFSNGELAEFMSRYRLITQQSDPVTRDQIKLTSIESNATIEYDIHIYRQPYVDNEYDALFSTPTLTFTGRNQH
jgi:hypothetical protein